MAVAAAGASQGAGNEHLSDGQSDGAGAPKAPEVPNNGAGGDGVVPKDEATKAKPEDDPKAKEAEAADDEAGDEDEDDDKVELTEWSEFDDPSANAAIDLLKEAGVSPAEADGIFSKAIQSGDLRDIDVKALEAKVGKNKTLLIMNGVKDYHQRTTEQNDATVQMVHDIVGGEAAWNQVRDWAQAKERNDKAFKKELDGIREDLNKGGRAAKAAAKDLVKLYNGSPNTKGLGNAQQKLTKGDGKSAKAGEPMTRAAYVEALKKAHSEGASPQTIAALDRRRLAGKQAGI